MWTRWSRYWDSSGGLGERGCVTMGGCRPPRSGGPRAFRWTTGRPGRGAMLSPKERCQTQKNEGKLESMTSKHQVCYNTPSSGEKTGKAFATQKKSFKVNHMRSFPRFFFFLKRKKKTYHSHCRIWLEYTARPNLHTSRRVRSQNGPSRTGSPLHTWVHTL